MIIADAALTAIDSTDRIHRVHKFDKIHEFHRIDRNHGSHRIHIFDRVKSINTVQPGLTEQSAPAETAWPQVRYLFENTAISGSGPELPSPLHI